MYYTTIKSAVAANPRHEHFHNSSLPVVSRAEISGEARASGSFFDRRIPGAAGSLEVAMNRLPQIQTSPCPRLSRP